MSEYFRFTATHPYVVQHLTANEIAAVTTWQDTSLGYDFNFHTSHDLGYPLYLCKENKHGEQMAKIDTKGKTTPTMVGQQKLTLEQRTDALAVATANWAILVRLARDYYAPVVVPVVVATSVTCKNPKCNIAIPLAQAPNADGFRVCPKCQKWN